MRIRIDYWGLGFVIGDWYFGWGNGTGDWGVERRMILGLGIGVEIGIEIYIQIENHI